MTSLVAVITVSIGENFWNGSHAIPLQWGMQLVIAVNGKLGRKFVDFLFLILLIYKFAFV